MSSQAALILEMLNQGIPRNDIASNLNISLRRISDVKYKYKNQSIDTVQLIQESNKYDILSEDKKKIHKLEKELNDMKKALSSAKEEIHSLDFVKTIINEINEDDFTGVQIPDWINTVENTDQIVPVFCLSDTHIGSVIKSCDVNYVNEYNVEIAKQRIFKLTDDFIDIYVNKFSSYTYPGVVCIFGGDMIEQAMHGTEETNDLTVVNQVIETVSILREVIRRLNVSFGKVFIPAVSGNHGRLIADKYVKNNDRFDHSLEKIVYHYTNDYFRDNPDVVIYTTPSDIIHFSINGLKFRLEHGDAISFTGNAISGPLNSYERARLKKSGVDSSVGKNFDVLILGHFHSHLVTTKLVTMASTKGYDTYVQRMALPFALPGATMFAVNAKGNIIFSTNLVINSLIQKEFDKSIEIF